MEFEGSPQLQIKERKIERWDLWEFRRIKCLFEESRIFIKARDYMYLYCISNMYILYHVELISNNILYVRTYEYGRSYKLL